MDSGGEKEGGGSDLVRASDGWRREDDRVGKG